MHKIFIGALALSLATAGGISAQDYYQGQYPAPYYQGQQPAYQGQYGDQYQRQDEGQQGDESRV